ncbi:hypothetical protein ACPFP2_25970 [Micromonospora citrea]|uniref:hypothetical protein n=1 Tax=Micromonospora citrea TaxID=47855 RepID=UPI003C5AC00E
MSAVPLDEWIAHLIALTTEPPPGADVAELTGMLGQAYLERYDLDPDEALLAAAVAAFDRAIITAPNHEQAVRWYWGLGAAQVERTRLDAAAADHDAAVAHLAVAYQGWPADDPQRDVVAVELIEAIWDRFLWRCLKDGRAPEAAALNADEVVKAVQAVMVSPASPDLATYAQMLFGMALLARYDHGGGAGA